MKRILGILASCVLIFGSLSIICSADVVKGGENTPIDGDFTATATLKRAEDHTLFTAIICYRAGPNWIAFWAISDKNNPSRVDFCPEKIVKDSNKGILISEEYQSTGKDRFVSVDDGWDASTDETFTFQVKVEGTTATVTLTGGTTGKSGKLTYDLTKGAKAGGVTEDPVTVLSGGTVHSDARDGSVLENLQVETGSTTSSETDTTPTTGVQTTDDENTMVSGDFKASATVVREPGGRLLAGIVLYRDDQTDSHYAFYVRSDLSRDRVDFFGEKLVYSERIGYMIADEYEAYMKDCFVSVDDGWDATLDNTFTLEVEVKGNLAKVKLTGDTTKKSGMLTYDLTKPAMGEREVESWNKGYVYTNFVIGDAGNLKVDYKAPTSESTGGIDAPSTGVGSSAVAVTALLAVSLASVSAIAVTQRKSRSSH